jgi:hypothetical protein
MTSFFNKKERESLSFPSRSSIPFFGPRTSIDRVFEKLKSVPHFILTQPKRKH